MDSLNNSISYLKKKPPKKNTVAQVQTAYDESLNSHASIINDKDVLIEEQNLKMTYMTNEFESMLNETLGRMSKKLELASQRWKDNDTMVISEANLKRLDDFQVTRINMTRAG